MKEMREREDGMELDRYDGLLIFEKREWDEARHGSKEVRGEIDTWRRQPQLGRK